MEITLNRSAQYFLQRTTRANRMINANQQWADYAFRLFEARQADAVQHIVQKFDYNQQSASVITLSTTGQRSRTYVVKLRQQMCSCGKWGTHGIPCSHAIQASRHFVPGHTRRRIRGGLTLCMVRSSGILSILSLCIIRRSELAEDRADTPRRAYKTKWIDHKDVPPNNIKLVNPICTSQYSTTLDMSPSATTWTSSV
ncbi:UNVERIFIED_CONTAM: hypothetical protein Slati_0813500 [Sesamum latifolium]|uniref:SWIM-type domain-containing protein n=1 Tax=Sesamum latifolium TaxID=2727402 RepID=A0AAW2XLP8_9LAMI